MTIGSSRRSRSFAGLVAAIVVASCGIARGSPPPRHTVCELGSHPQAFDGTVASVSGRIESDGMEYTLISDPACPAIGIGLEYTTVASHSPEARRLRKAIFFTGRPGTQDKVVTATLVGRFFGNQKRWPKRLILVSRVSDVEVRPK